MTKVEKNELARNLQRRLRKTERTFVLDISNTNVLSVQVAKWGKWTALPQLVMTSLEDKALSKLHTIWLSNHAFTEIPQCLFDHCHHLKTLGMANNELTCVSPEVQKLRRLQNLYLENNSIGTLPDQMTELVHLQEISLDGNRFDHFPSVLIDIPTLQRITLAKNKIVSPLPKTLRLLTNLRVLDLDFNMIGPDIPPAAFALRHLLEIGLAHNKISNPEKADMLFDKQLVRLHGNVKENKELNQLGKQYTLKNALWYRDESDARKIIKTRV